MTYEQRLESYVLKTEALLNNYLNSDGCVGQEEVVAAMRYSALSGGKRIRPALMMEFCRICGADPDAVLPFAAALEMIHTYSLIHDDLPCMDDDDLRRGKPTSHKVYGEAMAVLAGDALQTQAFELITNPKYVGGLSARFVVRVINVLSREAGVLGMIGGQVLDIAAENKVLDYDALVRLQERKTGALMKAAARIGCIVGGGTERQIQAAERYAALIGLAFQIQDDILDVEGDEAVLGKHTGSDAQKGKSTFPGLLGVATCAEKVRELTAQAISSVDGLFLEDSFLRFFAERLVNRKK